MLTMRKLKFREARSLIQGQSMVLDTKTHRDRAQEVMSIIT